MFESFSFYGILGGGDSYFQVGRAVFFPFSRGVERVWGGCLFFLRVVFGAGGVFDIFFFFSLFFCNRRRYFHMSGPKGCGFFLVCLSKGRGR